MRNGEQQRAFLIRVCGLLLLLLFVFGWSYGPTIKDIAVIWGSNPDYSHGYFVLPVALWLLWSRRESFPSEGLRASWSGLLLIGLAAAIRVFAARVYLPRLDGWTIPLWVAGVAWVGGGWKLLRWSAPCVAFLWFMMPLPGTVEQLLSGPLQRFATTVSTWGLQCLAQPAIAEGSMIVLGDHLLEVERACSGLRITYGISALAVGYVLIVRCNRWTTVVLLASVLPVALLANAFRVILTGLMYQYASGELARRFSHDFAGFAVVPLAALLFWSIATWWTELVRGFARDRAQTMTVLTRYALAGMVLLVAVYFWHAYQETRAAVGFLTRATALEEQEDWDRAANYLKRYLSVQPDDAEVLARLAQTYENFAAGRDQRLRVLELYRQASVALPERTDLRLRRAELALELGRYDEAREVARKGPSPDDDSTAAAARIEALAVFEQLVSEGELDEGLTWRQHAVESLGRAIRLNPTDVGLAERLADTYHQRLDDSDDPARLVKADQVMEEMLAANQDSPQAWLARYRYQRAYHLPASADDQVPAEIEADLDRAIELGRENPQVESVDVLLLAGHRAERREDTDQARAFYDRTIKIKSTDYRGYLALGQLLARTGTASARQEAIRILRDGLANADRGALALKPPLAAALFSLGQSDAAEQELQDVERLLPYLPKSQRSSLELSIRMIRGEAQAAAGQVQQAASSIRQWLTSLPPPDASRVVASQRARAWLRLGDMYVRIGVYDQAAEAYARAGDFDPSSALWRQKAAEACELGGRPDTAISYYRQVADEDGSQPKLWLALARAQLGAELRQPLERRNWQPFRLAIQQATTLGADPTAVLVLSAEYALALETPESTQRSVEMLKQGLRQHPDSSRIWRALAAAHERRGEYDEAMQAVAEFEQRTSQPLDALRLRAEILLRAGEYEQARRTLQEGRAASDDPESQYQLQRLIVELDLLAGDRRQALQQLETLAKDHPRDLGLARRMAELAWNDRDWTALERHEKRLRSIEGEEGTLWRLFRARRLLQQFQNVRDPRFHETLQLARQLQTLRPTWPSLNALRGEIAERRGSYPEAILAYQDAMRSGDRSVRTAIALIELLTRQARYREAAQLVEQYRHAVLSSSRLASLAASVYTQQGDFEAALRLTQDWVEQRPEDPQGHIRLGRILLFRTTPNSPLAERVNSRAEQAFRRAIQLDPNDLAGWLALLRYHTRTQEHQAAQRVFDEMAGQIQMEPAERALLLAQLYDGLENSYRAAEHYRQAVDLADDEVRIRVLGLAAQFFQNFDPPQAEGYCRQILQRDPDSSTANTTLITILAQREGASSLREAFQLLEKSRGEAPSRLYQRLEVALLLRRNNPGDRLRAIQMLEELVSVPHAATATDQLRLARAYEQESRMLRAVQILQALAGKPDAPAAYTRAYLEFLQRNAPDNPTFAARAEREIGRLQRDPENSLNNFVALQHGIRGAKQTLSPDDPALGQQIRQYVNRFIETSLRRPAGALGDRFEGLLLVLLRENCVEEAIRVCQDTPPRLEPDQALWHLVVALVRTQASEEMFDACKPVVDDLLQESPDNPQLLHAAGFFYYSRQERSDGIPLLRRALAAAPDRSDVMNTLAFALAARNENLDEALELIETAISHAGTLPEFLDTKAVVLLRQRKLEAARNILQKTLQSSPSNPLLWLHLAAAHDQLGESSEARDAWLQARALNLSRAPMSSLDRQMTHDLRKFGG